MVSFYVSGFIRMLIFASTIVGVLKQENEPESVMGLGGKETWTQGKQAI